MIRYQIIILKFFVKIRWKKWFNLDTLIYYNIRKRYKKIKKTKENKRVMGEWIPRPINKARKVEN